jgi:hypothetical protein
MNSSFTSLHTLMQKKSFVQWKISHIDSIWTLQKNHIDIPFIPVIHDFQ